MAYFKAICPTSRYIGTGGHVVAARIAPTSHILQRLLGTVAALTASLIMWSTRVFDVGLPVHPGVTQV